MGFLSCTSPAINRKRNKSKPQRNHSVSRPQHSTRSVRRASGYVQKRATRTCLPEQVFAFATTRPLTMILRLMLPSAGLVCLL
jgi:hypothetical protein